ncbi:MAG TPA: prolyl oligopeptidase family serine peptidase, partial [Saprospiraceae bacterium]|nr:prolyl oligopeptidase family serine peptidase [Saprospiraceae bacterium]
MVSACWSVIHGQTSSAPNNNELSLRRIFSKPYIAGTRPTGARISPDGTLILFRWDSTAQNKYRYWMMKADGSLQHMLADTLLDEVVWSPKSSTVACTRKGDIFLTDNGFSSFDRVTKTEANEGGLQWSHSGNLLTFNTEKAINAFTIDKPGINELVRGTEKNGSLNLIDFTTDDKKIIFTESTDEGLPDFVVPRFTGKEVTTRSFKGGVSKSKIGIAPVDTGKIVWIKLPGEERFFLGDVVGSPDGGSVVIERFSSNRKKRELFVADTDSGKAKLIYEETDKAWIEGGLYSTRWMPDGKQIITTSEKDGWNHLYSMNPDGTKLKKLTGGQWEIRWFDIHPKDAKIFFLANKEEHAQWQVYALDLNSTNIVRLSQHEGTYEGLTLAKDGSMLIGGYSNFGNPTELVRISTNVSVETYATNGVTTASPRGTTELLLTSSTPGEFRNIHWTIPEVVQFKSRDGISIPAMIYKPLNFEPTKKYPVVVFVHGAGYLQNVFRGWSYYYREFMFHHRLIQKGYVVLEVEYRGSAGLGKEFRTDVYMQLGGKDLQDEVDGLEYLNHLGYIDSDRVGIYGGSYGGFMTLMGLFLTDKYACGAALRAVTSWENYYRHNPWYTEARLGKPEDNAEAYKISSPITYADSLKKPLLLLHGMIDDNVFFQDAVQLIS